MGNCFGKTRGNFSGEGRTLASNPSTAPTPSQNARAAAPPKITSPSSGKTLGRNPQAPQQSATPGEAAARAAEERVKASQGKGKLGKQLDAQRGQTQSDTLAQTARDNVAVRDADAATQARNYD